jgi:hypothetical protein
VLELDVTKLQDKVEEPVLGLKGIGTVLGVVLAGSVGAVVVIVKYRRRRTLDDEERKPLLDSRERELRNPVVN